MGRYHLKGQPPQLDIQKANSLLTQAASQGHGESPFWLARLNMSDKYLGRNMSKAAAWLEKAATQGHREAQYVPGRLYRAGEGECSPNYTRTAKGASPGTLKKPSCGTLWPF